MHRLGIIVPFRNRWEHLDRFTANIVPYLERYNIDSRVIVVEQDNAQAFNRGMLCNIGFQEAIKQKCDYVVFHDVDMIPVEVDYSYSKHPLHLVSDKLPFNTYFGGITLFPVEDFKKINGFSNLYWGWGFEDDDLRYRCDKNDVIYGNIKPNLYNYEGKTIILNGVDAYTKVKNKINYVRDFEISIDIRIGKVIYNHEKQFDVYPILTVQGYDLALAFNSFNRFTLQVFDKKGKYYDTFSEIITNRGNSIKIKYIHRENKIIMTLNNKSVNEIQLDTQIYNYKNSESITLGTNSTKDNFFAGSIDRLHITNNKKVIIDYNSNNLQGYTWKNKINDECDSFFHKVVHAVFSPKEFLGTKVPFRRESKIRRLKHEDSGFADGKWKHDMTRWNQIRFNNEIVNDPDYNIEDGLSTCTFIKHSRNQKGKIIHLTVGI